jgi:taurine dioxygenase
MHITTKNLTGSDFVAEVSDFSIDDIELESVQRRLQYLWLKHQVLVFHNLDTEDEHRLANLSKVFGRLEIHSRTEYLSTAAPELLYVSNIKQGDKKIGVLGDGEAGWHTDQTYRPQPAIGSLLAAAIIPETGGDTSFADMYGAYDSLSDAMKKRLEGLKALHSYEHFNKQYSEPANGTQRSMGTEQVHPVIRTHPVTGRKAIFVTKEISTGIVGMDPKESEELLEELYEICFQPKFVYRHSWTVGDGVLWDNACVMHRRESFDPSQRRLMKRSTIHPPADAGVPF